MASRTQPSFAGGELAPALRRRTDLAKYAVGADTIKNMIVLPQGGLQSRMGSYFIHETKISSNKARLVRFVFSITQAYILEFGDYYMRVYMDGGIVAVSSTDSTPYELTTPYPIADVWDLKFEQSADTLFVVHPGYFPRMITRTDHNAWTVSLCAFLNGPLMTENTTDTTITLSNTAGDTWLYKNGSITATASSAIFKSTHVGSIWGIRYMALAANYTFTVSDDAAFTSDAVRVIGDWTIKFIPGSDYFDEAPLYIEKSIDDGVSWFRLKVVQWYSNDDTTVYEETGSEDYECLLRITRPSTTAHDNGSVNVEVTGKEAWAYFKITGYTSSTVVTGMMQTDFNRGGTALKTWAEGDWSDYRGWQRAVTFYQNRLCFGGSDSFPNTYWMSAVDDYYNNIVSISQVEDESIKDRLPSRAVNAIEWMIPTQDLVVLTQDSEWTVSPSSTSGVLSYKQKITKQRTFNGCSGSVKPEVIGDTVVFLKRNANKVQGFTYTDANGYTSTELSVLADHLFAGYTITGWAYQQNPNSILWCVRSDGALLSFTYMRDQDVWAWTHHVTDGKYESVAVIPNDTQDDVYFIVNRTINGSTKRYVEMMAKRDVSSKTAYFGVDCGTEQTYSSGTTTVSGIAWLEGKTVKVIADGVNIGKKTVSSTGTITLDKSATNIIVGLGFDWLFKSLSIDDIGRKKAIESITVSVVDSQGGTVATDENDQFVGLPYPTTDFYTGDFQNVVPISGYDYDGRVILKGSGEQPMHIVAITPKVA